MSNTLNLGNGDWATKENSLLGYNSENGNYKPLPFDFTRASNGTFVNKSGLIETAANGVPRIDFLDNTKGALKLEPQRTNYITQSNDFSGWGNGYLYVTSNYAISPDGTQNASRCLFTGENQLIITSTSATGILTGSMYVKGVSGETIQLSAGGAEDLITLTGEWQRLIVTKTNINGTFNLNTFGGATARDLLIYAAQLEEGSYATSLINTQGSTVTRVADSCNNGGNDQVINSTEGVLYIEAKVKTDTIFAANCIAVSDGTDANRLSIIMYGNINSIRASMNVGGVSQFDFNLPSGYIQEQYYKIAVSYKVNDCKIFINGTKISTDTSATMPSLGTFDRLNFDLGQGLYNFYGNVKDLKLYNTALTDQELIALTTI